MGTIRPGEVWNAVGEARVGEGSNCYGRPRGARAGGGGAGPIFASKTPGVPGPNARFHTGQPVLDPTGWQTFHNGPYANRAIWSATAIYALVLLRSMARARAGMLI
jgi:hypothetical protein